MPEPTLPALSGSLDARFPVLLLPVSVQVKFVHPSAAAYELRVRIYPDQLGISTHEGGLTDEELEAGQRYWLLSPAANPGQVHSLEHWRALVARYGVPRASWILHQTTPTNVADLASAPLPQPTFSAPPQAVDDERWTRAAQARGLPDRFSVMLYTQATATSEVASGPVLQQLFTAPGRTYDAQTVPNPTTEFLQLAKVVEGAPLGTGALAVGFDPQAVPDLSDPTRIGGVDAGNQWTVDFNEAVAKGLGVVIPLTQAEYEQGFERLVVLGTRATDAATGQSAVHTLLTEHYYSDGLQLVPQGTPTNNTEGEAAGYSSREQTDAEASFELLRQPTSWAASMPWAERPDGQHLATALGLADELPPLAGALGHDTQEAMVMNRALWPATYGYFLEEMLRPLFPPEALTWTRAFFEDYVLARGAVPALRVGPQPYGVLPTTRFSAWEVRGPAGPNRSYAEQLQQVLAQLDATWTERLNPQPGLYPATLGSGATAAGFTVPPPDAGNLLTTLGLDATSNEYYQRYLIGPALADALNTLGQSQNPAENIWPDAQRSAGSYDPSNNPLYQDFSRLLDPGGTLGLPTAGPVIFGQTFQSTFTKLADAFADEPAARRAEGVLLDGQPLSETAPLAPFSGVTVAYQGWNYIHWLATATFDEIRLEDFTRLIDDATAFTAPNSLLYRLLRQAVLLEYWAVARHYLTTNFPNQAVPPAELPEKELFNITTTTDKARWAWLYDPAPAQPTRSLYAYLEANNSTLSSYRTGIAQLALLSTARLERLLAEHLDLGSYRLDAWRLAPVTQRLADMRQDPATAQGSHLGAFGWLEKLKPADHSVVSLDGTYNDPDNLGYIHAPSLTHGTAAAVLRQGYKSRQTTTDDQDPAANHLAVDVSSQRIRKALALLEGLRSGHSLGVLLGQAFERGLLEHSGTVGTNSFGSYAAAFRRAFPLTDEYGAVTGQPAPLGTSPEQAARQVVDGAALLRAAAHSYPYGVIGLPSAATAPSFAEFIAEQLAALLDTLDALGDLAVSEGIYQVARGNTDRATAVLESVAKGQFPPSPDVMHPPARGFTFTQRVLVHLPADTTVGNWPSLDTPRAKAAPRLNAWLAQFFSPPQQLSVTFGYRGGDGAWQSQHTATLDEAGLHPIDLLYLLDEQALQEGTAFDQLLRWALAPQAAADIVSTDARLAIDYTSAGAEDLRRRQPLLARLRQLVGSTRPAQSGDLQAPGRGASPDPTSGTNLTDLGQRIGSSLQALQAIATQLDPTSTATPPTSRARALYEAALFGIAEAIPALSPDANQLTVSSVVYKAVQARLFAASAVASPPATAAELLAVASALFGSAFRPDVGFTLTGDAQAAYAAATAPVATAQLLTAYQEQPQAVQEWLHGLAMVREPLNHLDRVFLIQDLLSPDGAPFPPLQPAQLATVASPDGDHWLGLPWPADYTPPADALSLVQWLPDGYDSTAPQCALWLDEWVETLPETSQTTALTFHYDQPNTEAPQSLLLVVSPRADTANAWTTADLLGAVNETLDLAKKRTVEPDGLAFTHLATVLPAVVAPVAQQAVAFTLDLGRLNDTARFNEEPLLP